MTNTLINDISARIPYGVRCQCADDKLTATIIGIKFYDEQYFVELDYKDFRGIVKIENCKPLLIPLTEMSEEKEQELKDALLKLELKSLHNEIEKHKLSEFEIDFYLKNHIDFRGLIQMGLAYNINYESNDQNN